MLKFKEKTVTLSDNLHDHTMGFTKDQLEFLKKVEDQHERGINIAFGRGASKERQLIRTRVQKVVDTI